MSSTDPLVLLEADGAALRARELWRRAFGPGAPYIPIRQPATPGETLTALLQAFWNGWPLTLVDPGWGGSTLQSLGTDPAAVNRAAPYPSAPEPPPDLDFVRGAFLQRPAGRLTLYSSGSTGLPKAVEHGLGTLARGLRLDPRQHPARWGLAYAPTHMAGIQVILQAFLNGNPLFSLLNLSRGEILDRMRLENITHLSATPTFYRLLLPVDPPMEGVRRVSCGGERLEPGLEKQLRLAFPRARLTNLFGTTEAGVLFAAAGGDFTVPPALMDQVRIVDGRLYLHRNLLAALPADRPDSRHEAADRPTDFFPTGDAVEVLERRPLRLRFLGRTGSMVKVAGVPVCLEIVEETLRRHQGVRDARVTAQPNSVTGHLLAADVLPAMPPPGEEALRRFLQQQLPPQAVPRLIRMVDSLPHTRSGKLQR